MARRHNTGTPDDYQVGYRKPPLHTRFKPGQSGNPKGRPRGSLNVASLINKALDEAITVSENGLSRQMKKREAIIKALIAKSIKGDTRALSLILQLMEAHQPATANDDPLKALFSDIAKNGRRFHDN